MIPPRAVRDRLMNRVHVFTILAWATPLTMGLLISIRLQSALGYGPITTGLLLLPMSLVIMLTSRRLTDFAAGDHMRLMLRIGPLLTALSVVPAYFLADGRVWVAVPTLVLLGLVAAHIMALHEVGSNNPDGVEIKQHKDAKGIPLDGIPFHPYYTVKDIVGVVVFLFLFFGVVFFMPEMGGYFLEYNNFIPADPLKTPSHIAPVWYFTPYYSMLRAVTGEMMYVFVACVVAAAAFTILKARVAMLLKMAIAVVALVAVAAMLVFDPKFWGVVVMGGAVIILFFLPWLDYSEAKSIRYRPDWHKYLYAVFVINFVVLGYLGIKPPSLINERVSQVGTLFYFGFFLLMPWWSRLGTFKPVPERVTFVAH
jgi:ubiquinol-cytochrome c reductase cytochrome b subunit